MDELPKVRGAQSRHIAVIGAGLMGTVIATLYVHSGYEVVLCDAQPGPLETFAERASPIARTLVSGEADVAALVGRVRKTTSMEEAVNGAFVVQEAVQENLPLKQEIFASLDRYCGPDVILATNTSSFLLTDICKDVENRKRVLGVHFITPAHIIKAVELIYADFTPAETIEWGRAFIDSIGHTAVACRERPGFLVNRLQYALLAEAYRILDDNYASAEDIDAAIRLSIGPRLALWGPLMTQDLVASKATSLSAMTYLHEQTGDPSFNPPNVLKDVVAKGAIGAAVGRGWYEWPDRYADIVTQRDTQLVDLLNWLSARNAHRAVRAGADSGR